MIILDLYAKTAKFLVIIKNKKSKKIKKLIIYSDPNLPTPNCAKTCSNNFFRGPTNYKNGYICNLKCSDNHQKCANLKNNELADISKNISCKPGYKRVNYNCVKDLETKKSYMYFSGCLNTTNMMMKFSLKNYFISIHMRIDKSNEKCSTTKPKKLYFVAYPHIIYSKSVIQKDEKINNSSDQYFYENIQTGENANITNLVNLNWNLLTFHYTEASKTFKLIVNNEVEKPAFTSNKALLEKYELRKILFCANNKICKNKSDNYNVHFDYIWGSAYYKNLKIFDGYAQNYVTYQEQEQYFKGLNLNQELFNLKYDIPFNTFNTKEGNIEGISADKKKLDVRKDSDYTKMEYLKQLDEYFPYSSKLNVFDSKDKYYFSTEDKKGGKSLMRKIKNNFNNLIFF